VLRKIVVQESRKWTIGRAIYLTGPALYTRG
jgi:hypothetical protein